ncbi:MAG TPA: FlgD immunoglobulin-like domain containing protein, partial [Bacteroidota bacterium]|nr:FlgD immunoglobulin-like domain containing protein [Bacteroidota bacterium]
LPPIGGNDGALSNGFENTVVTNEAAHSGTSSLKFNMPAGRAAHDGFVGTTRVPFADLGAGSLTDGDSVRISVWIKASGLVPDSAAKNPGTWAVGITPLWFAQFGANSGYNTVGPGNDYTFTFPSVTSFDWTKYSVTLQVPPGVGAKALETRIHVYSTFVGTVYFDDLTFQKVSSSTLVSGPASETPLTFGLSDNYPNPFNPSTKIDYVVPVNEKVSLIVYNVLGQRVRTLISGPMAAGHYSITWDGRSETGSVLSSGVYLYRLQAGPSAIVKKMLLLK